MLKYQSVIDEIFSFMHSDWMDEKEKNETKKLALEAIGKTEKQLNDEINIGVMNGYSTEQQINLIKRILS